MACSLCSVPCEPVNPWQTTLGVAIHEDAPSAASGGGDGLRRGFLQGRRGGDGEAARFEGGESRCALLPSKRTTPALQRQPAEPPR